MMKINTTSDERPVTCKGVGNWPPHQHTSGTSCNGGSCQLFASWRVFNINCQSAQRAEILQFLICLCVGFRNDFKLMSAKDSCKKKSIQNINCEGQECPSQIGAEKKPDPRKHNSFDILCPNNPNGTNCCNQIPQTQKKWHLGAFEFNLGTSAFSKNCPSGKPKLIRYQNRQWFRPVLTTIWPFNEVETPKFPRILFQKCTCWCQQVLISQVITCSQWTTNIVILISWKTHVNVFVKKMSRKFFSRKRHVSFKEKRNTGGQGQFVSPSNFSLSSMLGWRKDELWNDFKQKELHPLGDFAYFF